MKFVCDRCQTKYSIADDRVRGKVLKVKCKTCNNVITVREAGRTPSAGGLAPVSAPQRPATAAQTHGPAAAMTAAAAAAAPSFDEAADEAERTMLAPNPMLMEGLGPSQPAPARRRSTGPIAPVGPPDDGVVWYMALDGKRTGPFSKQQLLDKLAPLPKNADVHLWNEQLGDWKPPGQVPAIASELAARKKAPPPPPLPGTPRRPTAPPIPPLTFGTAPSPAHAPAPAPAPAPVAAAAAAATSRRPTPHPPTGAPLLSGSGAHATLAASGHGAHGAHAKLPPPSGAGGMQQPGLFSAALPTSPARADGPDPLSLLETPAPQPHMAHAPGSSTNGTGNGRSPSRGTSSDVLQLLNMPGTPQTGPGAAPRLMSVAPATTWVPAAESSGRRNKSAQLILVLLGVVGVIIVVAVMGTRQSKKTTPPPPVAAVTVPTPPPPPPEKVIEPPAPPVEPPPVEAPANGKGKNGKAKNIGRGQSGKQVAPTPVGPAVPPTTPGAQPPPPDPNARYRENRPDLNPLKGSVASRPPPSQADITKVISNNRGSIKTCYQRALTRDNTLTHGKIAVKLSIGISGRVKHIGLDGPPQFRAMDSCIKDVVQRWVFPQASEEYGTEFPLVFQGNE
jgi:predicted Zn finger-like uncharacterized protein